MPAGGGYPPASLYFFLAEPMPTTWGDQVFSGAQGVLLKPRRLLQWMRCAGNLRRRLFRCRRFLGLPAP